jgi:ABC-type transport system involved in multi-copper enzyme maturation permease subunit
MGAWCNFFYGWSFPQTASTLLLPFMFAAYILILLFKKDWSVQSLTVDFKPQVTLACACLVLAILVLSAIATAASTRLGQVMTIVICVGVFVASLLSNHFIGRHVFNNTPIATIAGTRIVDNEHSTFLLPGDFYDVLLDNSPQVSIKPGDSFYYGPTPNGFPLMPGAFPPFKGDVNDANQTLGPNAIPGVLVTSIEGTKIRIRHVGPTNTARVALLVPRPPEPGDYVFLKPTAVKYGWLAAWGVIPNLQFFWLLDAVSQHRPVPPAYVGLAMVYAAAQIVAFLSLAVILFQKRDVG